eukprot:2436258-Lingulodinium_polyedra.AAC.1
MLGAPGVFEPQREGRCEQARISIPGQDGEFQKIPQVEERAPVRRRFKISPVDVRRHGPTMGCPGCRK